MRIPVFILFAYLFTALQIGLADLCQLDGVRPELLFILMVYLAALAPTRTALWAALTLGLVSDLILELPGTASTNVTIIGPQALGYALGATLTFQIRTMLFRQHAISITLMVFLAALATHLLVIFLLSLRHLLGEWFSFWDGFQWSPTDQLVARFLMVLYTTALAFPVSWLLIRLGPLFAFEVHPQFLYTRNR